MAILVRKKEKDEPSAARSTSSCLEPGIVLSDPLGTGAHLPLTTVDHTGISSAQRYNLCVRQLAVAPRLALIVAPNHPSVFSFELAIAATALVGRSFWAKTNAVTEASVLTLAGSPRTWHYGDSSPALLDPLESFTLSPLWQPPR